MRALAEFIMRGRLQASLVALVGNLVPLISPAAIGLVTLRKGLLEGLLLLLWAAFPLIVTLFLSAANNFVLVASIAGLLVMIVAAEVLKGTVSWPFTLLAVLVSCSFAMLMVGTLFPGETAQVVSDAQEVLAGLDDPASAQGSAFHMLMAVTAVGLGVERVSTVFVLGFMSWLTALNVIASLLLARWWQSLLFNAGGFQREFHGLRMEMTIAIALMAAVVVVNLLSVEYSTWANMLGMPLLLAGLGLMHHCVKFLGLGYFWLILMYVGLLVFGPLSMVLIVAGFLDSFLNFRARLAKSRGQ